MGSLSDRKLRAEELATAFVRRREGNDASRAPHDEDELREAAVHIVTDLLHLGSALGMPVDDLLYLATWHQGADLLDELPQCDETFALHVLMEEHGFSHDKAFASYAGSTWAPDTLTEC
jgi:hypothetical protein